MLDQALTGPRINIATSVQAVGSPSMAIFHTVEDMGQSEGKTDQPEAAEAQNAKQCFIMIAVQLAGSCGLAGEACNLTP